MFFWHNNVCLIKICSKDSSLLLLSLLQIFISSITTVFTMNFYETDVSEAKWAKLNFFVLNEWEETKNRYFAPLS